MPEIKRIVDIHDGVTVFFTDGAYISLTLHGVSRCSECRVIDCAHFEAAVPHFVRRKWDLAEANCKRWEPRKYREVFIDPRIFFRPGELGMPAIDWGDEDYQIWELPFGFVATFADGGHIYLSDSHPDGATKCLKCGTRDCMHYQRVATEIVALKAVA